VSLVSFLAVLDAFLGNPIQPSHSPTQQQQQQALSLSLSLSLSCAVGFFCLEGKLDSEH
jgi:hypothetical protein